MNPPEKKTVMAKKKQAIRLNDALVLNRYLLQQFGFDDLETLSNSLKESNLEQYSENNESYFFKELEKVLPDYAPLSGQLQSYDENIISHTLAISANRDETIKWKYFQYLSLLFTEVYLDQYFKDKKALLKNINTFIAEFNDPLNDKVKNETGAVVDPYTENELNTLAFWNATGSGKTLLMHINIKQFQHYAEKYEADEINKILLVTPNEGLSNQHLEEFTLSGIEAEIFSKKSSDAFSGKNVEIIEISKLAETSGEKTVAVEAFETNNLVLIDEGHRGVAGEQWKSRRDTLSLNGFAFEYSATFGQAVSAANGKVKKSLIQEYAKTILFDYSYKYFYNDGYGKDFSILNIPEANEGEFLQKYMTGALLSFYQQKIVFAENEKQAQLFQIENPLWVFVGSSVNAVRTEKKQAKSDVIAIISFFSTFIKDEATSIKHIGQILEGEDGIINEYGQSIFRYSFDYIRQKGITADVIYKDILQSVFNTNVSGANVYLDNLKGVDGELGLRVGDGEYFGVINVGDEKKLHKLCMANNVEGGDKEFAVSLFDEINKPHSSVNVLIGSKKFTEGWSSWRVSTMGLMNVGRGQGSQIIQLFGRGVRLKGYQKSLKRSRDLDRHQQPKSKIPNYLPTLETLNIFGIRADYMMNFKEYLKEEGLPTDSMEEVSIPVMPTIKLDNIRLKKIGTKEGVSFEADNRIHLVMEKNLCKESTAVLDWYPKVQSVRSNDVAEQVITYKNTRNHLPPFVALFLDWNALYKELSKFTSERNWESLHFDNNDLKKILQTKGWFTLYIPDTDANANIPQKGVWQQIATALLKQYCERFYNYKKNEYLSKHLELQILTPDDENFEEEYRILIKESEQKIIENLHKLKADIEAGRFTEDFKIDGNNFKAIHYLNHLYNPLLYLNGKQYQDFVKITPVALNEGENQFISDLKKFHEKRPDYFDGKELYLLRNKSRSGIGFFQASNFYPDFILWVVEGDHQHILFLDPKGLMNITGINHPKLRFHQTIKTDIEPQLKDPNINLHSFIISVTPHSRLKHWQGGETIADFNACGVYFQEDQASSYVGEILDGL